jgi:hypothetical protein
MFTNQKGEIRGFFQVKKWRKKGLEGVKGAGFVGGTTAEPVLAGGEVLQPSEGGGEEELAAGLHERRKAVEKAERLREAADEIGGEDDVEVAEIGAESHGITDLKRNLRSGRDLGGAGNEGSGQGSLHGLRHRKCAFFLQLLSGPHKGVRVIDAENGGTMISQREGRRADGAADIEGTGCRGQGGRIKQLLHASATSLSVS